MNELDAALKLALEQSEGDPKAFAFYLTAPLSRWMTSGQIEEETAMQAIKLLHQLHPPYC